MGAAKRGEAAPATGDSIPEGVRIAEFPPTLFPRGDGQNGSDPRDALAWIEPPEASNDGLLRPAEDPAPTDLRIAAKC
jgi:hypothetical protein